MNKTSSLPRVAVCLFLSIAVSSVSFAQVDQAMVQMRYDRGKELARTGDYAGALNDFLWCFDEGMIQVSSFTGVRTSFLLSSIGQMMKTFPLAREALMERCDAAEKRALSDRADRRAVADFAALCATLGDDARLVKLYDAMEPGDPRRAGLGLRAFRIFVPQKRYADALVVMPFSRMKSSWESTVKRRPTISDPTGAQVLLRHSITTGLDYVEVLAGSGNLEHAREMADLLVDLDASRETQRLLEERLKRAGQPDLLKVAEPKK